MTWTPSTQDASVFAGIHWTANSIENLAAELYASNRATLGDVEGILTSCRTQLLQMEEQQRTALQTVLLSDSDCPDGWVLCGGICRASCFNNK